MINIVNNINSNRVNEYKVSRVLDPDLIYILLLLIGPG